MRSALAVIIPACLLASSAAEALDLPVQGRGRGHPFRIECKSSNPKEPRFMVGFSGYAGGWIDTLRVWCADWRPDLGKLVNHTIAADHASLKIGVSKGGGYEESHCPIGFISRIQFADTKGDGPTPVVHGIAFQCVSINLVEQMLLGFGGRVKVSEGHRFFVSECPRGQVATGLHGRSGTFVDALGLICGPIPVAAPAPPPPPRVPDGPPLTPIPSPGPAPGAPAKPSSLHLGFTGTWDSRTDKGWRYTITMVQDGRAVTGSYLAQNGDKGKLTGRVGANIMEFSWEQDGGFTGTGQFALSPDGNSFSGIYRSAPHPKLTDPRFLQGSWTGTRR